MNQLDTTIKDSISTAHKEAEIATEVAREKVSYAVDKRVMTAALIEKASRFHKQDLKGFLSDVMQGDTVSAYLTLHTVAKKRKTLEDKNQLQLCGIIDKQEPTMRDATPSSSTSTFIGATARYISRVHKTLRKRPVEGWGRAEREQFADVVKPLVELYEEVRDGDDH